MNKRVCFFRFIVLIVGPALLTMSGIWSLHRQAGIPLTLTVNSPVGGARIRNLTDRFVYDDNAVFEAVVQIRIRNCMDKYNNVDYCNALTDCDNTTYANTTCVRRFPQVLIIGAYKCGTRELIDFLAMHPMVKIKRLPEYETQYFDRNLGLGSQWYREQMPRSFDDQLTIEKSPSYFTSKIAPKQITYINPGMKLIALVREPVSRTISHFSFDEFKAMQQYGHSLGRCVLQKQYINHKRADKKINTNCFAVKHSLYYQNLKNYLEYFDISQIEVLEEEKFARDPCSTIQQVEKYLGLEPLIQCQDFIFNSFKNYFCVADVTGSATGVCYGPKRGRGNSSDSKESKELEPILRRFFKPRNKDFFDLIGRKLDWS